MSQKISTRRLPPPSSVKLVGNYQETLRPTPIKPVTYSHEETLRPTRYTQNRRPSSMKPYTYSHETVNSKPNK